MRLGFTQPREFIVRIMTPLWMHAAEMDDNGKLPDLDPVTLQLLTFGYCKPEHLDVLVEERWIARDDDGALFVPSWEEHEPFFANRTRQKKYREQQRMSKAAGKLTSPPADVKKPTPKKAHKDLRADQRFARAFIDHDLCGAEHEGALCKAYNTLKKTWAVAQLQAAYMIAEKKREKFTDAQHVIGWMTKTIRNAAEKPKSAPVQPDKEFQR